MSELDQGGCVPTDVFWIPKMIPTGYRWMNLRSDV